MESVDRVANCGESRPAQTQASAGKPLHRIAAVRRRQGVALRTVARVLNVEIEEAARQEQEQTDLPLSVLQKWQAVLDVPIAELLVESEEMLSAPVLERARLIRVMKTAATLLEKADSARVRRLSETLIKQLVEIMPELEGIGPWHEYVGPRRRRDECGRIAERQISSGLSRAIDSPDEAA
jgi:transcriptional regulator with XRE-family HTH domain